MTERHLSSSSWRGMVGGTSRSQVDQPESLAGLLRRCHLAAWYVLCIAVHATAVMGDFSTLGVLLLTSVTGVSASPSQPTFGGGNAFRPAGSSASFLRSGMGQKGPGFRRMCGMCDNYVLYEGWQMHRSLVTWQVVADLIITVAYISVPVQLYYFAKKSKSFPYKPLLLQFGAFLGMLGFSHFINLWTYDGLPRVLMLAMTAAKLLTAFISCTTAITAGGFLPDLLGVHQCEVDLRAKTELLDAEVLQMLRKVETAKRVREISAAVEGSLERDAIGSTACAELRALLGLENAALWLPTPPGNALQLAYESVRRATPVLDLLPISDATVQEVVSSARATVISETSDIALKSCLPPPQGHGWSEPGAVAAVPIPLLSNADLAASPMANLASSGSVAFAIIVLVLPPKSGRQWRQEALEVAESVADQVAVALAHAAVLEDSQRVREQLMVQETNLRLAEFEGKSAVRARDNFLTVMKHEMRTPMHSITALSSLLAEGDLESAQRSMVGTVARSSALLSTLVSDILDFWRLEDDRVSLNLAAFELPALVKEAETLVAPIAKDKGLALSVKAEPNLPPRVSGDSNRLLQIMLNVVGISMNATGRGGSVTLSVAMEKMESARNGFVLKAEAGHVFVRFEVKDSGEDLEPSHIPQLFAKFQDDDGKTSRSGLGLALSQKFVQLHEGHIWIESGGPGGGATSRFIVRLKLEEDDGKEEEEEDEWDVPDVNFYALRIMVVDDNMINRLVTKRLLESIGSQTKVVDSGKECLRLLKERTEEEDPYDVLLLDLMMPEMDGYTTATKIHEEVPEKNRPVIVALTANADETTKEKCLQHGMVGMITKPISLNPLRDILGKMLDSNAKK